MSVTITLKIKDKENKVSSEKVEIDSINGFQFQDIMKVINSIAKEMQSDESLKGLFEAVFGGRNVQDMEFADISNEIIKNAIGSFDTLLLNLPDKAYELLAAATNVEKNVLLGQKMEDIFDVYDAIIETNDVEKLVARIKKSLTLTQTKTAFLNLGKKVQKATKKTKTNPQ